MRYVVEATKKSPNMVFENEEINISGSSIQENPHNFYDEIEEYLSQFEGEEFPFKDLNIKITYINTSSLKRFMNLVKIIIELNENIVINWSYEEDDEDMLEIGKIFSSMLEKDMNFISYQD